MIKPNRIIGNIINIKRDRTSKQNRTWRCKNRLSSGEICGQLCVADKNPTEGFPKWKDGHICNFEEDN